MLSLLLSKLNLEDESGLVKMSTSWSLLDGNLINRDLLATMSRTKWKTISTCFVRAWKTGFEEKYVAPILSHHNVRGWVNCIPISEQSDRIHDSSAAALARALYSALVLDLATVCCFLQVQEIKLSPRKIQYPHVERRSSRLPTQSASE
jgi:hypothetical protein